MKIKVRITTDEEVFGGKEFLEFVGIDSKVYRLYPNQIIKLPFENAILLIKEGIAIIDKNWVKEQISEISEEKFKKEFKNKLKNSEINWIKKLKIDDIIPPAIFKIIQKELEQIPPYLTVKDLLNILGTTIKHDNINKLITFFSMLTAYTEDSQFNVSFRAPSSTGKSYIPIELAQYFPKEDVMMIAYSSPTSFYHDTGNWDEKKRAILINLERKILIFLDQPHDQLLQRLRPLLSHDQKELLYKVTDKRERKGLRTKNVIIKGFPSVIFCTGALKIDEQEATRNFILSPETTTEKIREGVYLKALRKGNPLEFERFLKSHPEREMLKERIKQIKEAQVKRVMIKNVDEVFEKFIEKYDRLKPRHQRDIERLISLIQALALLNLWYRERDNEGNIYANEKDIENAFKLFDEIAKSQELGIPPYIYRLFKEVIEPLYFEVNSQNKENPIGLTRRQIITKHYEKYGRTIQDWFLRREILPALESAGLIVEEPDPEDERRKVIHVHTPPFNSPYSEKNRELRGGVGKFIPIEPYPGRCSYCGEMRKLRWKDSSGYYLCDDCKEEERG